MTRLFVAVWPPEHVVTALGDVERPRDPGVKWVAPENLHVTLRFLGDADDHEVIERLDEVLLPATQTVLGPAFDVLGEHSIVLPAAGLDDLAHVVRRALRGVGTASERRRFVGHVTLARLGRRARPHRSVGTPFTSEFDVTEVALVTSTLRETGAEYETLATWPTR